MAASDEFFPNFRDFFGSKEVSWLKDFLRLRGIQTIKGEKEKLINRFGVKKSGNQGCESQ